MKKIFYLFVFIFILTSCNAVNGYGCKGKRCVEVAKQKNNQPIT